MRTPSVDGVMSVADLEATGDTIAQLQLPNGMIEWYPAGHADPWNHVESAMALSTVGRTGEAEAAYQWLLDRQRSDGSWHNYYLAECVEDPKIDVNCVAYVATGAWHHYLCTKDTGFAETMFPVVDRAIDCVLDLQTRRGEVLWARTSTGHPWSYALLTGSASIGHSLRCALDLAELLGHERPTWRDARLRLVDTVANLPEAFEPKDRWAMDWYYPVLTGAVTGDHGAKRLATRREEFVMPGQGVRCVSNRPWVTAAETCEFSMALLAVDDRPAALELFTWAQLHRTDCGSYDTGIVYPEEIRFPEREQTSYTAAAVILAADALDGSNPTSTLFTDHTDDC